MMEHHAATTSPTKATAIPRFSKLPTPRPSTTRPTPTLDKDAFSRSTSRPSAIPVSPVKTALPKLATTPATNRTAISTSRTHAAASPAGRPISSLSNRTATSQLRQSTMRPSSRLAAPRRPAPRAVSRDEDADDQLGALDSFRAASRLDLHETSPPLESPAEEELQEETPKPRKPSRPSLSDRTIESLNQLPSTPNTSKRRSSFFAPQSPMLQSPMPPPSRPASAMSMLKRPVARDTYTRPASPLKRPPMSAKPVSRVSMDHSAATPSRRSTSATMTPRFTQSVSSAQTPSSTRKPYGSSALSSFKRPVIPPPSTPAFKTATKPLRPSVVGTPRPSTGAIHPGASLRSSATTAPRPAPPLARAQYDGTADTPPKTQNPSATLRDQIAKAKAAKRAAPAKHDSLVGSDDGAFDLSADPFNHQPRDNKGLLRKRIDAARADGRLNIAAMGLKAIPDEVLRMYDADQMTDSKITWSETVDLTRLVAADNEMETIADEVFPDIDREAAALEEESNGLQFRGLDLLDLHGNMLQTIPSGLRHLDQLTTLDLSHNKLGNSVFDTISQVKSLKHLKLAHNNIAGYLPQCITKLVHLETLDLQANKLLSLPEYMRELAHLRVLNVSENQLTGLPMDALESLPLVELNASRNALVGALFPFSVSGLPFLQTLNVTNNSLASLAYSENLSLPVLRVLSIANNRIASLPDMAGWTELVTLAAEDNKISAVPVGFTTLKKIKHADLTSNNISRLDERIALMASLETFLLAANPLKERRYLGMSTDDIKSHLQGRLEPAGVDQVLDDSFEDEAIDVQSQEEHGSPWKVAKTGALNLGTKGLEDNDSDALRSFLGTNDVRELQLSRNKFSMIPFELSLAQNLRVLDMSMCLLGDRCLDEAMALPGLRELHLRGNKITSLEPLLRYLHAPYLQHLDVSNNKLGGSLPVLRTSFPQLVDFNAADNKIEAISAKALTGLHSVVLARNNIMQVPAEIGLLWHEGLRGLDLSSNAFRVPNHRVLEKGTEATMTWLRDRMPGHAGRRFSGEDEMF